LDEHRGTRDANFPAGESSQRHEKATINPPFRIQNTPAAKKIYFSIEKSVS
jgi:hypothetical protein